MQQGNTILVDTPGIGGSGTFKERLMEYLPNAVCFIFVIDVLKGGGLQDDRVNILTYTCIVKNGLQFTSSKDLLTFKESITSNY